MSALVVSIFVLAASTSAPDPSPQSPERAPMPASSASSETSYSVEMGIGGLIGLLPPALGGVRIVEQSSGRTLSAPEVFKAAGREDLAQEFYERLTLRWIMIVGAGALGVSAAAAFATGALVPVAGVPAGLGLPWTLAGISTILLGSGAMLLTLGAVVGGMGVVMHELPVGEDVLESLAAGLPSE